MLAAVLPLFALSVGIAWWNARLTREAEMVQLRHFAVAAANVVDSWISKELLLIEALARSPSLSAGNIEEFDQYLHSVATATGVALILGNRAGEPVVNSDAPRNARLQFRPVPEVVERILAGGKPDLSNVFISSLVNRPLAALAVAVPNGRPEAIIVAARIDPWLLAPSLPRPDRWDGAFVVVYDGKGRQFVTTAPAGATVPDWSDQANSPSTDPQWLAASALGYAAAVQPISGTSWHVAVLAREQALAAKVQGTIDWLIVMGVAVIALASLLSVLLGRMLVNETASLVSEAHIVVEGGAPQPVTSLVSEFADMRKSLQSAAAATRETVFAQARLAGLTQTAAQLEARVAVRTHELEETTGRLLSAQDDERRRIAREMHDSTVQELIAASMHLRAVRDFADGRSALELREALAALDRAKDELRTLAFLMQPPLLDECGIVTALRVYAEGFGRRSGLRIEIDAPEEDPVLPREVETALFRVAQEALTNVHRHANCAVCRIRFRATLVGATLEIEDDGRGIPSSDQTNLGVGIAGMRARTRQLGGNLTIESGANGTKVRVSVPLPSSLSLETESQDYMARRVKTL